MGKIQRLRKNGTGVKVEGKVEERRGVKLGEKKLECERTSDRTEKTT